MNERKVSVNFPQENEDVQEIEDDVFIDCSNDVVVGGKEGTGTGNTEHLSHIPTKSSDKCPPQNVSCQTDFSDKSSDAGISEDKLQNDVSNRNNSYRTLHNFCWRHNIYEVPEAPGRPPSPTSYNEKEDGFQDLSHTDESFTPAVTSRHVVVQQRLCSICKNEGERRLDLKSRRESVAFKKVPASPSLATVKHCSVNLLHEEIPNCSELWKENQTFYLGTNVNHEIKRIESRRRYRPRSVPAPAPLRTCIYCEKENDFFFSKNDITSSFCDKHSFRIRSLSLNFKEKTIPYPASCLTSHPSGPKDWILVQKVTKKIPSDPKTDDWTPYYCETGQQELIFCLHGMRSVTYIEDICCQHFLSTSRKEAMEQNRTVELLFSPKGPVMRDDKHLKGRSIFYFCCHVERARPKSCSSSTIVFNNPVDTSLSNLCDYSNIQSGKKKSTTPQVRYRRRSKASGSSAHANDTASNDANDVNTALSQNPSQDSMLADMPVSFSPNNFLSSGPNAFAAAENSIASACSANACHDPNNQTAYGIATTERRKKRRGAEGKRVKKEIMRKSSKGNDDGIGKTRKTVTFSSDVKDATETTNHPVEEGITTTSTRRSSMPPPPKLKINEEEDDMIFRRKRRESVAICFNEVTAPKPKAEKPHPVIQESPVVATYQRKQWKSINVTISFKNRKFTNEFYEYKSLQDLYTWLRQELLAHEILTPGAELLLSSDNLKFPLKANTAMTILSSLPASHFQCSEIVKGGGADGGLGESSSKYDTRFALPLDTSELEGLTPVEYLSRYCVVSNTWKAFYISIFASHDKYKNKKLNYKEVTAAMERLFVELAHPLMKRVIELMGLNRSKGCWDKNEYSDKPQQNLDEEWKASFAVDAVTFVSMCSLANRIICRENEIDGFSVNTIKQSGTQLEDADFYNIEGKISEHKLNPLTKRLLLYIRNKGG